jgi:hypothetical protein
MELLLTKKTKIKEVKKAFSLHFPFLKLEFFQRQHNKGESSWFERAMHDWKHLEEGTTKLKEGVFAFTPAMTVAEFEKRLQEEHGLPVQIFRKSGSVWLETVQTDNMTLEKQNALGEESLRAERFNIHTLFL